MEINIAHFYPYMLNLCGDKGNIAALSKRLEWRNIAVNVENINPGTKPEFSKIDIALFGGGSDREQLICYEELKKYRNELSDYIENDGVFLALCGGYPVLGKYFEIDGNRYDGLGILDIYTENSGERFVSNVVVESESGKIAGFENHPGRTYINNHTPLGKVLYGNGNNGEDKTEGVIYKNTFATYLHGPLLPKNAELCDEILRRALKRKYGEEIALEPLDDAAEDAALNYVINRFIKE